MMENQNLDVDTVRSRIPPGKQKRIWRINKNFVLLYLLILLFIGLTFFAFLKENFPCSLPKWLINLNLLTFSDSIKGIVSLFSLYVVLEGVELNFRPFISYKTTSSNIHNTKNNLWIVEIINKGKGSAIIEKVEYELVLEKSDSIVTDFNSIVMKLAKIEKTKFIFILNISDGFSISSNETLELFKIPIEKLAKIERLDLKLFYKSYLGQLYYKKIYFLPINKTAHNNVYKT